MKFEKIDPPGSWCQYEAVQEIVDRIGGKSFLEVGCGAGELSLRLCQRGMRGVGVDFSKDALGEAERRLSPYISKGQFQLREGDITKIGALGAEVDLGISMMVMEHVQDDVGFLKKIAQHVRPGGYLVIGVPGRRDCWNVEDETVGHLRRYDRKDLVKVMTSAGIRNVQAWSVAVPVANLLFRVGNLLLKRSGELSMKERPQEEQTKKSGIREIPFKTVFPAWFKLVLNRYTLYPFFLLQRAFYRTNLGLTVIGFGEIGQSKVSSAELP